MWVDWIREVEVLHTFVWLPRGSCKRVACKIFLLNIIVWSYDFKLNRVTTMQGLNMVCRIETVV